MSEHSMRFWRSFSIRTKLLIAFVTLVLIPILIVSAISIWIDLRQGQTQIVAALESAAEDKAEEVKKWIRNLQNDLKVALAWNRDTVRHGRVLLSVDAVDQEWQVAYDTLRRRFMRTIELTGRFDELFMLSRSGIVVLSTDSFRNGEFRGLQAYFKQGLEAPGVHVQLLSYSSTSEGVNTVIAVDPVKDDQGRVAGVMCGRASLSTLNEIMLKSFGLGQTGETYMVGANRVLLTQLRTAGYLPGGVYIRSRGVKKALEQKQNGHGFYSNYRQVPVIGVHRWLPALEVALMAEVDQAEAYGPIYAAFGYNAAIAFLAVLFAGVASLLVTRTIAAPITKLAGTATRIADGELELTADIDQRDEIGVLAQAFNNMTAQLRDLIGSLEQRVVERTAQLDQKTIEKEAAEGANTAKSEFLARMSHEIRTPLNAVTGLTHIVLKSNLTDEQRDYLNKAQTASKHLLSVINDILDFSKVEAGQMELVDAPFDLDRILDRLSDMFSERLAQKDLEMIISVAFQVPRRLTGDAGRLTQVLTNLVENAVKFSNSGEIIIRVKPDRAAEKSPGKTAILFEVEDNGIGIPEDVLPTLFDPFTQADTSLTREYEGTGLGLTICRRMVDLMGGRIWAESLPGKGSTFSFSILLTAREKEVTPYRFPAALRDLKALVVDDSPAGRQVVVDMLDAFDCNVSSVSGGQAAIATVNHAHASTPFQLVVMDLQMSGMDGASAARRIRESRGDTKGATVAHRIPFIILVSASGQEKERTSADTVVADAWLSKPVKPRALFNTIMTLHGRKASVDDPGKPVSVKYPVHGLAGRRVLVVEDSELNLEVAVGLLNAVAVTVDIAENGKVAVDKILGAPEKYYDAVLMDIQMPIMDGYEATRRIRAWEDKTQNAVHLRSQEKTGAIQPGIPKAICKGTIRHENVRIPIIALTAHAMNREKDKCIDTGMDGYIAKPIDEQDLHRTLLECLQNREKEVNL